MGSPAATENLHLVVLRGRGVQSLPTCRVQPCDGTSRRSSCPAPTSSLGARGCFQRPVFNEDRSCREEQVHGHDQGCHCAEQALRCQAGSQRATVPSAASCGFGLVLSAV